jgi:hypothetical protein
MGICRADNIADNQIDNKAIDRIEQPCNVVIFGNETSFVETIGVFGGSGVFINTDLYVLNETIGQFGASGVILITGTF